MRRSSLALGASMIRVARILVPAAIAALSWVGICRALGLSTALTIAGAILGWTGGVLAMANLRGRAGAARADRARRAGAPAHRAGGAAEAVLARRADPRRGPGRSGRPTRPRGLPAIGARSDSRTCTPGRTRAGCTGGARRDGLRRDAEPRPRADARARRRPPSARTRTAARTRSRTSRSAPVSASQRRPAARRADRRSVTHAACRTGVQETAGALQCTGASRPIAAMCSTSTRHFTH